MSTLNLISFYVGEEIVQMVTNTGVVGKIVLLILLAFSVFSWAIMLSKWGALRRARAQSGRFLRAFRKANRPAELVPVAEQFRPSPLVSVFEGGMTEIKRQGGTARNINAVQRAMQIASSEELSRLETRLSWLATVGTVSPFIGLFGTVWGIIDAFHGLGTAGAATLRAVAPGISEALIATAAGLFAAIPAVIAYNHFTQRLREFGARMDDFSLEFLNAAERDTTPAPRAMAGEPGGPR
ncbi:MAG: protein TolQ [Acidobacteriales bacterium]|nr:protein TolQ [Terriglobales bacterium]